MWAFEKQSKFKSQYKKFQNKDAVKKALCKLAESEKPETLGEFKKHLGVWI